MGAVKPDAILGAARRPLESAGVLSYQASSNIEPNVTPKFKYRGNLAETTLPEMLYTIDRFRVPGVIEVRRGGLIKRVYIRDGYIIHASSSNREDSLGAYLLREETVPREALESLVRLRQSSNKRLGVLLVERGILAPGEVFEYIREQIEAIVWGLFYWQEGEVAFGVGDLEEEEMVQIQLPIKRVIVQGIKSAPDAKPLASRLGSKQTVLEPCFEVEDLIETGLDRDDYSLLRRVNGSRTLYQLCAEGPRAPAESAKLLYAFQVLKLVRLRPTQKSGGGPLKIKLGTSGDRMSN
jgi:hypothetical protein